MPHAVARVSLASAVVAAGLLAACSSAGGSTGTPSTPPTTSSASTPANSSSAASSSSSNAVHRCSGKALKVALGQQQGAMGSIQLPITFTNVLDRPCTLQGYPGLDALDQSGAVIVHAARQPGPAPTLTLDPGNVASALVTWQDDGKMSASIALTPPNTDATTRHSVPVGVTHLTIQAVQAGSGS